MLQNVHQISKVCKLYKIHIRLYHSYLKFQFFHNLAKACPTIYELYENAIFFT